MCTSLHFSLSWHEKLNLTLVHLQFQCNQISIQRNAFDETFPSMKTSASRTDIQTINIFSASYEIERRRCDPGDRAGKFCNTRILIDLCWFVCCSPVHKQTSPKRFPWEWRRSACVTNSFFGVYFRLVSLEDVFNSNVEWWKQDLHTALSLFCVSK